MKDIRLVFWDTSQVSTALEYSFDTSPGIINGRDSLIQMIVKNIMTMKGTNAMDKSLGSSMPAIPGTGFSKEGSDAVRTNILLAIRSLESDIISRQRNAEENGDRFTNSEKLKKLALRSSKYVLSTSSWKVTIDVYTEDEQITTVSLPL